MDFVTLGMFIIDEIHFQPPIKPVYDVIGGAGSWAVAGARLFLQSPQSRRIGWTIHKGNDFPGKIEEEIDSWDTNCNFVDTPHRLTTRGWNKYGSNEERGFRYMTEKLRVDETQLTEEFLLARSFHLICTATRCTSLVNGILLRRRDLSFQHPSATQPPLFVWEPVPDSCSPDQLQNVLGTLPYVDVVSPNNQELTALFGDTTSDTLEVDSLNDMKAKCSKLLHDGFKDKAGAVVVRCGRSGCYVATADRDLILPAYYQPPGSIHKVVDPTGAGNAFLGGFCIGYMDKRRGSMSPTEYGAVYGSVAASFAVEQVGLPSLDIGSNGKELWNGVDVYERLAAYLRRVKNERGDI